MMTLTANPDLSSQIRDIVAASPYPLDAAAIRRGLKGEFALKPKQLPALAAALPSVAELVEWPAANPKRGPRYWTRTPSEVAQSAAITAAAEAPVVPRKIVTAMTKGRTGIPRERAEALLRDLEESGKLHRKPLLADSKYKLVSRLTEADREELLAALSRIQRSLAVFGEIIAVPAAPAPLLDDSAVLRALEHVEPRKGLVVTAHRLRAALPEAPKKDLDQAVMRLYRAGKVLLHRHSGPLLLPEDERQELIQSGADYFVGICWNTGGQ